MQRPDLIVNTTARSANKQECFFKDNQVLANETHRENYNTHKTKNSKRKTRKQEQEEASLIEMAVKGVKGRKSVRG